MLDLVIGAVALLALIGMIVIVARKFPILASIDTKSIPAEQHQDLKLKLMEERLQRRLNRIGGQAWAVLRPAGRLIRSATRRWYDRLLELERRYQVRLRHTTGELTHEERRQRSVTIESIMAEAQSALRTGALDEAEQAAIEALGIDPRSVPAYQILADIYVQRKDYEHARETLRFMIDRLHVQDDKVFAELGQVATDEGRLDEAKEDIQQSIALNGSVAQHYLDLCQVELALGDSTGAFESCRRAVELEPNNPKFLDALVEASIVAGKRDWASEALEKLRAVNPENQKLSEFSARVEQLPKGRARRNA